MRTSPAVVAAPRVAQVASAAGWVLILAAVLVLSGWALGERALIGVMLSLATMKAQTAAAFLLAGLSLVRRGHRDFLFYSLGVLAIGMLTLIEDLANADLGIDQLLIRDPYSTNFPGRMSQITSVGFTLLGPALALTSAEHARCRRLSRGLANAAGMIGVVAILGYSYDTQVLYQVRPHSSIAIHTAAAFVIAAIGVNCVNPNEGLVGRIHGNTAGGAMLRRLLPTAVLIPYLLGFFGWIGHKQLHWEMGFSLALVVATVMACLIIVMFGYAKRLDLEELALRESEERFRLVANTAPVMIWMSGTDKLCTYFNKTWLDFTGRKLDDELGDGWLKSVHPDDAKGCMETYLAAFERHEPFQMQYRLRRQDGEYRWVLDTGVPRFIENSNFAGYIGSCIDVTHSKLAEEAFAELGHRLLEAQEDERTWIARELHDDINQRIALLSIELETCMRSTPHAAFEMRDYLGRALDRLRKIGTDIQALSHRLHSSQLDYLGLPIAAAGFCKEFSDQQKVEIDFRCTGISPSVPKEISLCLFRVLQEALQNALKHSGVRRFTAELTGDPEEIRLLVRDSGVGFDPLLASRRHGLGLISMRERVQLVNGEFTIHSQPGHGTTVQARVQFKAKTGAQAVGQTV